MCFFYLTGKWVHDAPREPNDVLGAYYSHNEHGSYVYFTAEQATTHALLFATSIPLMFLGAAIMPKANLETSFLRARWDRDDPHHIQTIAQVVGALLTPLFVFQMLPILVSALNQAGVIWSLG